MKVPGQKKLERGGCSPPPPQLGVKDKLTTLNPMKQGLALTVIETYPWLKQPGMTWVSDILNYQTFLRKNHLMLKGDLSVRCKLPS